MNTFISILIAIFIFCLIVVVHEFGHFFVAKLCGIRVDEFSIGMGPAILKKQGKETLYSVRILPIGGFCSMGEDIESDDPESFRNKPVFSRMAVIVAGAFMNIILGIVISLIAFCISGKGVSTTVVYLDKDAESAKYGLQLNDTITEINGMTVFTAKDITYQLSNDPDGIVNMVVKRPDGQKTELNNIRFKMEYNEKTGKQTLKYDFKVLSEKITIANIFPYTIKNVIYYGRIVLLSLRDLISGQYGINDLQGPVGIVSTIGSSATEQGIDIDFLLQMATLVTINVGIFNLLPLPALDGGRFIFLIIEAIRRKPIKAEVEGMVHFAGMALLMLLMIVVTVNDVTTIFK